MRGDLEYLEFIAESIQLVTEYTRSGTSCGMLCSGYQNCSEP